MKKAVLTLAMLVITSVAFSQTYFDPRPIKKDLSFQTGVALMSYNDYTMYGYSIGFNYREAFEVGFFHVRDYQSKETFMDTRWGGWYASLAFPVNDCVTLGPLVRFAKHDYVWQKPYFGAELKFDLSWNTKIAIEYGKGQEAGMGVKLLWNLY